MIFTPCSADREVLNRNIILLLLRHIKNNFDTLTGTQNVGHV